MFYDHFSARSAGGRGGGGVSPLTNDLWKGDQCFSCGLHGHGVNRCSQLDITFLYVLLGWSVDVRNGQYRPSRMRGNGQDLRRGKEGWFGREGQPPGPLMIVTHLTQVGVIIWLGDNRRMAPIDPDGLCMPRVSQHWGASLRRKKKRRDRPVLDGVNRVVARNSTMESISRSERDGGHMAPLGRNKGVPRRGMRPAGVSGPAQQMAPVGVRNVKGRSAVRPLSVEAVEFSPTLDSEMKVMSGQKIVSSEAGGSCPGGSCPGGSCPGGSCRCPYSDGGKGDVFGCGGGSCLGLCD